MSTVVNEVTHCSRCGKPRQRKMFCECGLVYDRTELRTVRLSGDEDRGRALSEMFRGVEAGKAEFQRDIDQRFEREVEAHYSQMF